MRKIKFLLATIMMFAGITAQATEITWDSSTISSIRLLEVDESPNASIMKTTKRYILTLVAMIIAMGAWAATDEEVVLTPTDTDNEWTFTMPAGNVELEVEYYTDEELFTDGVVLTCVI